MEKNRLDIQKVPELDESVGRLWEIKVLVSEQSGKYLIEVRWKNKGKGVKYFKSGEFMGNAKKVQEKLSEIGFIDTGTYGKMLNYVKKCMEEDEVEIEDGMVDSYIECEGIKELANKAYDYLKEYMQINHSLFPKRSSNAYERGVHKGVILDRVKDEEKYGRGAFIVSSKEWLGIFDKEYKSYQNQIKREWKRQGILYATEARRYDMKVSYVDGTPNNKREYGYIFYGDRS